MCLSLISDRVREGSILLGDRARGWKTESTELVCSTSTIAVKNLPDT